MNPLLRKILIINIILAVLFTVTTIYTWNLHSRGTFVSYNPIQILLTYWGWTPEAITWTGIETIPNYPFLIFLTTVIVDSYYFIQVKDKMEELESKQKENLNEQTKNTN